MKITENAVEEAAIEWLTELGYEYAYGPDLLDADKGGERTNVKEAVLRDRLESALKRLNPGVPPVAISKAVATLCETDVDLVAVNHRMYRLLRDGVKVEFERNGEQVASILRVVDFENFKSNDFLVVNQFTIQGPEHTCRPDVLVFINGLPLAVIELKNPADENADVWMAYDQIQNYKNDIPVLFHHNAMCIISDYSNAMMGSLTAKRERYQAWRTIDGVETDPLGPQQELETLIRGVFDKYFFVEYLKTFILFEDEGSWSKKSLATTNFMRCLLWPKASFEPRCLMGTVRVALFGTPKEQEKVSKWSALQPWY